MYGLTPLMISVFKCVGGTGVFLYILAAGSPAASALDEPPPEYDDGIAAVLQTIDGGEVMGYVNDLQDFGTRYSYTNKPDDIANWLQGLFDDAGYNSYIEPIPAIEIRDVFALDGTEKAWVIGRGGRLFSTNDEGTTWTVLTSHTTNDLNAVFFADENVGFAVGDKGTVISSTDGGSTWQLLSFPDPTIDLKGFDFIDENTGWVCGTDSGIFTTDDGGMTWVQRPAPAGNTFNDIFFISEYDGWVCGDNGFIAHSGNGGRSWAVQSSGTDQDLQAIEALDKYLVWAVGGSGEVRRTNNGGQDWFNIAVGAGEDLLGMCFVNKDVGYITGSDGVLLTTDDGGNVWVYMRKLAPVDLYGVSFTGDGIGYAAGGPKCLFSDDGGDSFEEQNNFDRTWSIVVGEKSGKWIPDEIVIFCANYDSISDNPYSNAPGADGNASGVAAMIAASKAISEIEIQRTLRFIYFPAGEQERLGSVLYADGANDDNENIVAVVNPGLIGSRAFSAIQPDDYRSYLYCDDASENMAQRIAELAAIYEIDIDYTSVNDPTVALSDHAAFRKFGYPALLFTEAPITQYGDFPNPLYRTAGDTVNKLEPDLLYGNTLLTTTAALYLARIYTQCTISQPYPYGNAIAYPNPARV
ncbi:MAG: M28 family peptidase, partial [bacterium]|nr:M28 family peptidase [bacterium]